LNKVLNEASFSELRKYEERRERTRIRDRTGNHFYSMHRRIDICESPSLVRKE
jgi:hypothetical protein